MNQEQKNILARRYAQACIHIFAKELNYNDCIALKNLSDFLNSNPSISFFLQISLIKDSVKMQACDYFINSYALPKWMQNLFQLLLDHKRLFLLAEVVYQIVVLYMSYNNIEVFTITSAHSLTKQQQDQCYHYLQYMTHKNIIIQCVVDASLIAGIRMQSNTMIWEYSIKKQLSTLQHIFFPIGEDYDS